MSLLHEKDSENEDMQINMQNFHFSSVGAPHVESLDLNLFERDSELLSSSECSVNGPLSCSRLTQAQNGPFSPTMIGAYSGRVGSSTNFSETSSYVREVWSDRVRTYQNNSKTLF